MKIHIRPDKIKDLVVGNGFVAGKHRGDQLRRMKYDMKSRRNACVRFPSVEGRTAERGSVAYKSIDHGKFHRSEEIRFNEFNTRAAEMFSDRTEGV